MTEAEQLRRLADAIDVYVAMFGEQPPAPPFVPLERLIAAYEHAITTGVPIPGSWMPGAE